MLIAIEGIDQSGKATLARHLKNKMTEENITTSMLSFPNYDTPIGQVIRMMLNGDTERSPRTMQLLCAANRYEALTPLWDGARAREIVILDRYIASGIAYGAAHDISRPWLETINDGLPAAGFTILVDVDPDTAHGRKPTSRDLYESNADLAAGVITSYRRQARNHAWIIVDGNPNPQEVAENTWRQLKPVLSRWTAYRSSLADMGG